MAAMQRAGSRNHEMSPESCVLYSRNIPFAAVLTVSPHHAATTATIIWTELRTGGHVHALTSRRYIPAAFIAVQVPSGEHISEKPRDAVVACGKLRHRIRGAAADVRTLGSRDRIHHDRPTEGHHAKNRKGCQRMQQLLYKFALAEEVDEEESRKHKIRFQHFNWLNPSPTNTIASK